MEEYTVLEAARLLGLSKNTVKYRMKKIPEEEIRHGEDGRLYVSAAGVDLLRGQFRRTTGEPVLNQENRPETGLNQSTAAGKTGLEPDKPVQASEEPPEEPPAAPPDQALSLAGTLQAAVDLLGEQLAEKDRQIAAKDQQIREQQAHVAEISGQLSNTLLALQATQEQLKAAQALHAGTIQKNLLEAPEPEAQAKTSGFWRRLLGRR